MTQGLQTKKKGAFATSGWSRQLQDADTNYENASTETNQPRNGATELG